MFFEITIFSILRFVSNQFDSGIGFQLKYNRIDFACGGTFSNDSGLLTSPMYPNPYPAADCIYIISQPNGTFVNISFLSVDITCEDHASGTDFIEIRDGNSEGSPLIGKFCGNGTSIPPVMMSTQGNLRIR